jgi:LCP family protein required for cell wall assembly
MSTTTPSTGSAGRPSGRAAVPGAPTRGTSYGSPRSSGSASPRSAGSASPRTYGSSRPGGSRPAGTGTPPPPPRTGSPYRGRKKGPHWGRIALVGGLALVLVGLLTGGGLYMYYRSLDNGLNRDDPFAQLTGGRPAKTVDGAINMLLLGSDSRDPDNKGNPGQWRTDTIIVLHIPASHDKAYLVSLPRDLYVHIPKSKSNPQYGDTKAKINASFAWGGTPLTVQTVEDYTQVRMDHVVLIDFGGFKQVIDALGGIDMNVEQDVKSIHAPFRQFKKGMMHMNGDEALDYARQRYQFADGDFARMRHQQQMMKAILDKAASSGTLGNPKKLNAFLKAVTSALTVDKDFSLADMAIQFHGLRSQDLTFLVSPNKGSQNVNGESVVVPDKAKATELFDGVKNDKVADYVTKYGSKAAPSASTGK